ncbi:MAG: PilZ domain-containing protein [Thermodesulfobacteriota bacterium]|jgi:hypothetical protein
MEEPFNNKERRSHPRFLIDLPLEYRVMDGPCLRGGIVVNVSEGGLLIETVRDIPVGKELNITVLFPKGFELADFKVVAMIVWKEPYRKEDLKGDSYWKGYQYGVEFMQVSQEDRLKLNSLLGGQFEFEETFPTLSCGL